MSAKNLLKNQNISARNVKANKIIARGAEAIIYITDNKIVKERVLKQYRLKELDTKLRGSRTRKEGKLLHMIPSLAPEVYAVDEENMSITMEYIQGILLRDYLDNVSSSEQIDIMKIVGGHIARLHAQDIIHGDLTTSNMIYIKDRVKFIDFGLGFISARYEDKAVDLHLFHKALESSHIAISKKCFDAILVSYQKDYNAAFMVLKQYAHVEKRGRYKRKQFTM